MVSNSYRFTEKAKNDFDAIIHYISDDLNNITAAKNLFTHVFSHLDRVCLFPESCPLVDNEFVNRKGVRKLIVDNFLLYYLHDKENSTIVVLRIAYAKRDLNKILQEI